MLGQVWLRKLREPILGGQPAEIEGDRASTEVSLGWS